jgi:putative DNA methylase
VYLSPTAEQEGAARAAHATWEPQGELADDPRNLWCVSYGLVRFADLFTPRQLVTLTTFSSLVGGARERVIADGGEEAYADAVATYLALAVDKAVDRNTTLCSWESGMDRMRNTFGRQALPMVWDFAETNSFAGAGGDLRGTIESVCEVLDRLREAPAASVRQLDAAARLDGIASSHVATDPPYYDNVAYADLSDFFYVWLRRSLGAIYPDLFGTLLTPKEQEMVATPSRFDGDRDRAEHAFEQGLRQAFRRMHEVGHPEYPLTLFYAFKQTESMDGGIASTGWETMLTGLLAGDFAVTGTWPVRSELGTRSIASGTNALASSIVLVCRPRDAAPIATRRDLVTAMRYELPGALKQLQHGNIAPVDLAQAAIGPGMAIFSRYAKVIEANGEAMTVRTALGLINATLAEILEQQEGDLDADTRFAITWFEQYGLDRGPAGAAITLTQAKGTALNRLQQAGIIEARAGEVRLLERHELDAAWDPAVDSRLTVWEVAQHLIRRLEAEGEGAAGDLLRRVGGLGETARELAYRLYTTCERKGWAQAALAYNALVVAWPEIARQVTGTPEAEAREALEL